MFPAVSIGRVSAAGQRSAKVVANAFSAGFHLMVHRAWPFPVGSRDRVAWTCRPATDADLMAIEIARGKRYFPEWNTARWWMSHEAYQRQPAKFLANFESGLRIFADHGIGVIDGAVQPLARSGLSTAHQTDPFTAQAKSDSLRDPDLQSRVGGEVGAERGGLDGLRSAGCGGRRRYGIKVIARVVGVFEEHSEEGVWRLTSRRCMPGRVGGATT